MHLIGIETSHFSSTSSHHQPAYCQMMRPPPFPFFSWIELGTQHPEALYASEWWGEKSEGHTVLRSTSDKGNGVVSVVTYPSSKPSVLHWASTERWLQQRYEEIHECRQHNERFRVLGYQWRALRFNDDTRQSTAKVLAAFRRSEPESIALMQQPHCLAVPFKQYPFPLFNFTLKSMVAAGLATIASCNYNLMDTVSGTENMRILCIGQGGGRLPLFLASKMQGAVVDVVEIDPLVISASVRAMGFPAFSIMTPSGKHAVSPNTMDKPSAAGFTRDHGTVVVNLHSDSDILDPDGSAPSVLQQTLPMGKYVLRVCRAYKNVVVGGKDSGLGFTVSVPWVCNSSLVVCRGFRVKGGDSNSDIFHNRAKMPNRNTKANKEANKQTTQQQKGE
ncbi:hypothetical protein FF1_012904 [Malus domestica]